MATRVVRTLGEIALLIDVTIPVPFCAPWLYPACTIPITPVYAVPLHDPALPFTIRWLSLRSNFPDPVMLSEPSTLVPASVPF